MAPRKVKKRSSSSLAAEADMEKKRKRRSPRAHKAPITISNPRLKNRPAMMSAPQNSRGRRLDFEENEEGEESDQISSSEELEIPPRRPPSPRQSTSRFPSIRINIDKSSKNYMSLVQETKTQGNKTEKTEGKKTQGKGTNKKKRAKQEAEKGMDSISLSSSDELIEEGHGNAVATVSGDSRPPHRDNSSENSVIRFNSLSGHRQFLTKTDCEEILKQPHAFISSDALLWLMTSVGNSKYDPEKHYLFDLIHLSSRYMCGQGGPSNLLSFNMGREAAESICKEDVVVYVPLHFKEHFSLVVVEGLSGFLSCVKSEICECSPVKVIKACHYDSLALSTSHKIGVVKKAVSRLIADCLHSLGHNSSLSSIETHVFISRITTKKDQPSGHVTCGPFVALYFRQHLHNIPLQSNKEERRELLMDMLHNLQHEVGLHYDAFLIRKGVETPQRSPTASQRPRNYALDSITDELDANYYRIEFDSVLESMSPADLLQLCNHWIDSCLWNACGKDRETIPMREESDKVLLKTKFKGLYADKVKKGPKIRSELRRTVLSLSMGAMLHAVECCYTLVGGDASEHIFIAMRSYPESDVWCGACDLLFNAGACSKINIDEERASSKASPLQKYVRQLFSIFQGSRKSSKHISKKFTSRSRVIMQEICVHVVAIVEYTLQCLDLAVFDSSFSASEKDNAVAIQFDNIGFVELEHSPHHNSGRFVKNSEFVSEKPFGKATFMRMRSSLELGRRIMNSSASRVAQSYKTDTARVVGTGKKSIVPSPFLLRQIPHAVFAETLSAIEERMQSVLGCAVGSATLNGIQKLFSFSNQCFAASHGLPSPKEIELASLKDLVHEPKQEEVIDLGNMSNEDKVIVLEPPNADEHKALKRNTISRKEDRRTQVPKKKNEGLASSQSFSPALSLTINDSAHTMVRYHETFSPNDVIYVPCVFELLFSVLHLRHSEGRNCQTTCSKRSYQLFSAAFTSFLQWEHHGWMASNMSKAVVFRLERLRDAIVRGSMTIASVPNLACIEIVKVKKAKGSKRRKDATFQSSSIGQTDTDNAGKSIRWAGNVLAIRKRSHMYSYPTWSTSSSVAIGEICFSSRSNDRKLSTSKLMEVEVCYELQWSPNRRHVPKDSRERTFDFRELDFVALTFLDEDETETRFGILLGKPTHVEGNEETRRSVRVAVLNDEEEGGFFQKFISIWKKRSIENKLFIQKLGTESIHQHSKVFGAIWEGFFKLDRFKILGLSDPSSLVRSYAQRFWDMASMIQWRLVQENANKQCSSIQKALDQTTVQHGAALSVEPCDVAKTALRYARDSICEVVKTMKTTVNDSQLQFLVSWCSHVTAYHLLSESAQRWLCDVGSSTGPGRKGDVKFMSSMFFCQGPPGTGKSHVVTILVWATTRKHLGSLLLSRSDNETNTESRISDDLTGRALVLTVTNAAVDDLLMKYFKASGNDTFSEYSPLRLGSMSTEKDVQKFEIYALSRQRKCRPDALINSKRATFSTLGSAMAYDWHENIRSFDVIVIDEAAYASEPETTAVLSRVLGNVGEPKFGTSVVLVGDQAQLPPFDDNTFPCWTTHRARTPHFFSKAMSVMSMKLSFPKETSAQHAAMWEQTPRVMFQFQKQMRSAPSIGWYVSDNFYAGKISNGQRSRQRYWVTDNCMKTISSDRFPLRVVNFVNTKQNLAWNANNVEVPDKRGGYRNEYECHVILEMLRQWKTASQSHRMSIGILTPYISQKNLLAQALEKEGPFNASVLTFASAQGKEFDVVILSLVRTYVENSRAGNKSTQLSFLNDKHSACVALSRAREVLIVLGKLQKIAAGSPNWNVYLKSHRHFPQSEDSEFKDFVYLEPQMKNRGRGDILTLAVETEPSF